MPRRRQVATTPLVVEWGIFNPATDRCVRLFPYRQRRAAQELVQQLRQEGKLYYMQKVKNYKLEPESSTPQPSTPQEPSR